MPDIMEILRTDGRFGNFAAALKATGLDDELQQDRLFTVFAPTDDAFGQMMPITSENDYSNTEHLRQILKSHILTGRYSMFDLSDLSRIVTAFGDMPIRFRDGRISIGGAWILDSDIEADNGIIHVVDSMLIPSVEAQG